MRPSQLSVCFSYDESSLYSDQIIKEKAEMPLLKLTNAIARIGLLIIVTLFEFSCQRKSLPPFHSVNSSGKLWVTGYLPGWRQSGESFPCLTKQDLQFLTHIIHFAVMPKPDGSLDTETLNVGTSSQKLAVRLAHEAGKPILLSIVGQYPDFQPVIAQPQTRRLLIENLVSVMASGGYDGIDLDMEPVCAPFGSFGYRGIDLGRYPQFQSEFPINQDYIALVQELRRALDKHQTPLLERPMLTAAVLWRDRHIFGKESVHKNLDQINLMTYDMCGPDDGWVTWFDSPLYNGGFLFPKYGLPAYSIEMFVDDCIYAGIPPKKLGIGICLDALVWRGGEGVAGTGGVTAPRQTWTLPPSHPHTGEQRYSYAQMMEKFYRPENYHWDDIAQAPYLSIDLPGSAGDMFISFNDERSVKAKIDFIKQKGLGGFIIWELGGDYCPSQPPDEQRPLKKAMQQAVQN